MNVLHETLGFTTSKLGALTLMFVAFGCNFINILVGAVMLRLRFEATQSAAK